MTRSILEFSIKEVCEILKLHVKQTGNDVGDITVVEMRCDDTEIECPEECDNDDCVGVCVTEDNRKLVFQMELL